MYIIVLKKTKSDIPPFPTTEAVKQYIQNFGDNDIILGHPGFMSNNANTIQNFCKNFYFNSKNLIVFSTGMNGQVKVKGKNNTILDEHLNCFKSKNIYKRIQLNNKLDHSKFLLFIDNALGKIETEEEIRQLLLLKEFDSFRVKALLIGSSNMSYITYYGNKNNKADKGECDILLIDEKKIPEIQDSPNSTKNSEDIMKQFVQDIKDNIGAEDKEYKVILTKQLTGPQDLNRYLNILFY